ncbi:hypothetical protein BSKO_09312 [Bryopsis sp. KO-2023]|nr:hypothetical protein BSKO_09312 [Bryopsis sp. KO-2023]
MDTTALRSPACARSPASKNVAQCVRAQRHAQPALGARSSSLLGKSIVEQSSTFGLRASSKNGAMVSRCQAASVPSIGTPKLVQKNSVLVVGATGTLGRQIVRQLLEAGYEVRCLIRPRPAPADFLRDWGAKTVSGDLLKPNTLPATLVGIHTIIDCATARPEEPTRKVDWDGKKALIQCAQAMGIQRYVFFSIFNCDQHREVPLMNIKKSTEMYLEESGLNYTTLRLCGFMQAIIGNYAVPILEESQVWGTDDDTKTAYLDTQDVARMTLAALRNDETIGRSLTLAGPRSYTTREVISMCESRANAEAKVTNVPVWLLKSTRLLLKGFQWARDAADRLAFAEVLSGSEKFEAPMAETYRLLDIDPASITSLESYLDEYFKRILSRLKEVAATSRQTDLFF